MAGKLSSEYDNSAAKTISTLKSVVSRSRYSLLSKEGDPGFFLLKRGRTGIGTRKWRKRGDSRDKRR